MQLFPKIPKPAFFSQQNAKHFETKIVTIFDDDYEIRELSVGERMSFEQFTRDNQKTPILLASWLVSRACREFEGQDICDVATQFGPRFLDTLALKILAHSGLTDDEQDAAEKKS